MTGFSVKMLRFESREPPVVTSRSLLDGILSVSRMELCGTADGSGEDREIDTGTVSAAARVRLVGLCSKLESGGLGRVARAARGRRE